MYRLYFNLMLSLAFPVHFTDTKSGCQFIGDIRV